MCPCWLKFCVAANIFQTSYQCPSRCWCQTISFLTSCITSLKTTCTICTVSTTQSFHLSRHLEVVEVRLRSCWHPERWTEAVNCLRDEVQLFAHRISIIHEVFRDFVSARSFLFMELLLHNVAEDVISRAAKPSDLCLYSYRITEGFNIDRAGTRWSNVPN